MMELPKNYDPKIAEEKWQKFWVENNIFSFDEESEKEVFSIDTPPPTHFHFHSKILLLDIKECKVLMFFNHLVQMIMV